MNSTLPDDDPSIDYYDSDYPSRDHGVYPENLDPVTEIQGVAHDVDRYVELLASVNGPILEIGCGTGRVAIPLARTGHAVTSVDVSDGMLDRFREKLKNEADALRSRLTLVRADATELDLPQRDFAAVLLPFNTLPCIPDFAAQRNVLARAAAHARDGALLLIDLINPRKVDPAGDPTPRPFFSRRNIWNGRRYTRFAAAGPMDAEQRQELKGWYDELDDDGRVRRTSYSILWRPLHRSEIELMLETAGFTVEAVDGDHRGGPFNAHSPKMFIHARRNARNA